jgi:hypothetical protein
VDASERLQGCRPGSSSLVSWRKGFKGMSWAVESHVAGACLTKTSRCSRKVHALEGVPRRGGRVSGPQTDQERGQNGGQALDQGLVGCRITIILATVLCATLPLRCCKGSSKQPARLNCAGKDLGIHLFGCCAML